MADLLPGTADLLYEVLEGLEPDTPNLPELRMGKPGRSGSRYWHYGRQKKRFDRHRPASEFEELKAAGFLRKLRTDKSTGTYFAFTPAAFRERDAIKRKTAKLASPEMRQRPDQPSPDLTEAPSRLGTIGLLAEQSRGSLSELIAASGIERTVTNDPSSSVVFIPLHPWRWKQLPAEHRPLQGCAKEDAERLLETCRVSLAAAGPEHLEEFDKLAETVRRIYVRGSKSSGPLAEGLVKNAELVNDALDAVLQLIDALPGAHGAEELLVVPDTNALIQDPDIENWQTGSEACTIVIVSQVQAELDRMKVGSGAVAEKAKSLIRKFKEYSRRGNTLVGVPLSGPRSFKEIAISPDLANAPSWLSPADPDDRILAATLDLAASSLTARVVLVTRDRGLQNKARSAECPAVDVDDL
jgi:rRNA-processing protein FCF1